MITREYLDEIYDDPQTADMPDLIAALRRVLDLRDEIAGPWLAERIDAALAGTQTDDGAVTPQAIERIEAEGITPAGDAPAPSSPGRIEAVAQAIAEAYDADEGITWGSIARRAVAALDAYDRERPPTTLRDALAEVDRAWAAHASRVAELSLADMRYAAAEVDLRKRIAADVTKMRTHLIGGEVYVVANDVLATVRGQS